MGFRTDKLARIRREQGIGGCASFLLKDVYFRIIHRLAFPGWRRETGTENKAPGQFAEFIAFLESQSEGRVLEIGSRAVSDISRRALLPAKIQYTGLDILAGPNVDVIGDAHELGTIFPKDHFDGIFSYSVFEHLLMPWKVVLEMNAVMKVGGLAFVGTHPTWPPHELPWDFWRYQPNGFWSLFNSATGFEIVNCATFEPARLIPKATSSHLGGTVKTECAMGIVVLAKKTGSADPRLAWPVNVSEITKTMYPARNQPKDS